MNREVIAPGGNFVALYAYGSEVYGNAQPHSDFDYVAIRDEVHKGLIIPGKVNLKLMSPEHFQGLLDEHRMTALECYFLPDRHILKAPNKPWRFKLDKQKLFETVSNRSHQDWAKARLRFERSNEDSSEVERGKKSLYHSMRLLMFGVQIAQHSTITDYGAANALFEDVMTDPNTGWEHYENKWTTMRETLLDTFLQLTNRKPK